MVCTPPYDHPNRLNPRIRCVGNAECGCCGESLAPEGDQAVPHHPRDVGALPQCPMAALAAEDGARTTVWHSWHLFRAVEYDVGSAVHDCGGVLVAHPSSQAVAYTPQGSWSLASVPLAGSTICSM